MKGKLTKKVNVSPKRQITIPKELYDHMDIKNNRVQISIEGKRMIVEPVAVEDDLFDFTDQIRSKLEKQGFTGKKLATRLAEQMKMVDKAFSHMIKEAEEEYKSGKTISHKDLFADIDGEE